MPTPEKPTLYAEMNLLDKVIDNVLSQNKEITQSDINRVTVAAQVQTGIDKYRAETKGMTSDALLAEEHNSTRLGWHLQEQYGSRPPRCHAHAIVAGKHHLSAPLRLIMAKLRIRIDDTDNGCWLPENTAATPHPAFPSAPPHSRIHRHKYYFWVDSRLSSIRNEGLFRTNLNLIAKMLTTGTFPSSVLLPKSAESFNGGRK
jgi:hypothetical protein